MEGMKISPAEDQWGELEETFLSECVSLVILLLLLLCIHL